MKRLTFVVMMVAAMLSFPTQADAQGWLNKLKNKTVDKVKDQVDKTVDDGLNSVLDGKSSEKGNDEQQPAEGDNTPEAVSQNQKSDFVRGSVILFE